METLEGTAPKIEIIDCPFEDDAADLSADVYYKADEDPEIAVDVDTAAGEDLVFGIDCDKPGLYEVTLEGSSQLEPLAQLPMTIYITGIPFSVVPWNGTNGETVTKTAEIGFLSKFAVVRFHFGKRGLALKRIKLRYLRDISTEEA